MSLKRAAASGVRWIGTGTTLATALQLLQTVILARLLVPTDFGLVAMILVVLGFAHILADLGVSNAIIHRPQPTREELSSIYWPTVLIGAGLCGALVVLSPVIWPLFDEPRLRALIPIAALEVAILPWGAQFRALMEKNLRFRELALFEVAAAIVGTAVAIGAAVAGAGVLALVFGQLANSSTRTMLLCRAGWRSWRPLLHLRLADIRPYRRFALFQIGERTLNYTYQRLDYLMIGMLLGAEELGYYNLAYALIAAPIARINPVLTRVAFPVFARAQDDVGQLTYGFMTMRRVVAAINFPILFGAMAVAPVFVPLVLGDTWLPSIVLIQILALVVVLRSVGNPIGSLLLAVGRPDLGFYFTVFAIGIQLPAVFVGATLAGAVGVCLALVVTVLLLICAEYLGLVRQLLGPSLRPYVASLLPAGVTACLMAAAVFALAQAPVLSGYLLLATQIVAGAVLYGILNWVLYCDSTRSILRLAIGRDA